MKIRLIPEQDGAGRLGRHVEHDPHSREFGVTRAAGTRNPVLHRRYGSILDQGDLGSCTGNALVGAVNTVPIYRPRHVYGETRAISIYKRATVLDGFDGSYPPDDTGSSGLAACKAAVEQKLIGAYRWAFGIEQALDALQVGAVMTGVDWHEGFDHPDARGLVKLTGQVRGGHEFVVRGYDPATDEVFADNSWTPTWGFKGSFRIKVADWATLLGTDGDVVVPSRA